MFGSALIVFSNGKSMSAVHLRGVWALALCLVFGITTISHAQLVKRLTQQNVQPVFEGWERNSDGTFNFVFGYMNRNYEEQPDVPIGASNNIEPGGPDQGQPTYFYPRRQQFVFKVRVPADWGEKRLIWTVTLHGRTDRANAWLNPEYELTSIVWSQNRGGAASDAAVAQVNEPPSIKVEGELQRTASVGEELSLDAFAIDDGHPKPSPPRIPRVESPAAARSRAAIRDTPQTQAVVKPSRQGMSVTWVHYRGPGDVTFKPMNQLLGKDGRTTTTITFSEPGTHVIRAYADDGVYTTPADVTVVVKPRSSQR
jgi:hypothetical protein